MAKVWFLLLYKTTEAVVKKRKFHFFPDNIETEAQMKLNYKRLALLYHPDRGGSEELMRELNVEYEYLKHLFSKKVSVAKKIKNEFAALRVGDTVYVNGTECVVVDVFEHSFIAQAKGRVKLAIFDRETGYAINNRKYKATTKPPVLSGNKNKHP
jgi:DnaJ-class molecular chaperone